MPPLEFGWKLFAINFFLLAFGLVTLTINKLNVPAHLLKHYNLSSIQNYWLRPPINNEFQ